MNRPTSRRAASAAFAVVLLFVGCSDAADDAGTPDDDADAATTVADDVADFTEVTPSVATADGTATDSSAEDVVPFTDGPLADVCPATVVVQLDDAPSVEHGALYRLLGPSPAISDDGAAVSGTIVRADGTDEDVALELRSGGPSVAFRDPIELMATDTTITLGVGSTADVVASRDVLPTWSIMALTDRSPAVILWDPATYPAVDDVSSLAAAGVEIRHAPDEAFIVFLAARGTLDGAELVDSYLGEPAGFVEAEGAIAQQGDALVEPQLLAALPQWGRPVSVGFAADDGWASYDDTLVVRTADHDALAACLDRLVPVVQDAIIAHLDEPSTANAVIADVRARLNPLTRTSLDLLDRGVADGVDTGVLGAPTGEPVGSLDMDRLGAFLPELASALGLPDLTAIDVATDRHVRPDRTR